MGSYQARQTHCKHGHPFDLANTRYHRGERICIACQRNRKQPRGRGIGYGVRRRYQGLSPAERLLERFVRQINWDDTDCWPFKGVVIKGGYRQFKDADGRNVLAHRWAFQYFKGPIPAGLTVDHVCCREECSNPDHLDAVTMRVNIRRGNGFGGINARKTKCPRGHVYDREVSNGPKRRPHDFASSSAPQEAASL